MFLPCNQLKLFISSGDNESDKENSHPVSSRPPHIRFPEQVQPDYNNIADSDDSEDDEVKYKDDDYDPSE